MGISGVHYPHDSLDLKVAYFKVITKELVRCVLAPFGMYSIIANP